MEVLLKVLHYQGYFFLLHLQKAQRHFKASISAQGKQEKECRQN